MKKKVVLFIIVLLATIFVACGSSEENSGDTFKVGMEANYAPFNWTQIDDSNG